MRDDPSEPGEQAAIVLGDRHLRLLKIAVIAMGVVLVLGFVAVIARIVYLVGRGGETATTTVSQPIRDAARLALPSGAVIRNLSLSGSRLAVHYDSPRGSGIVILDLATGAPAARIDIVPEVPR
jgi:uncharacterized protein YcfJ